MSKTTFTVDFTEHNKKVKRLLRKYRFDIFKEMARVLDLSRQRAADKYIIPAKYDIYREKISIRQLYRLQPSDPSRVTSRTGILKRALTEKAKPAGRHWRHTKASAGSGDFRWIVAKQSRLENTSVLKGLIKVVSGAGTSVETYRGTLRVQVSAVPKTKGKVWDTKDRSTAWLREGRMGKLRRETPQTVAMRFKHDTGIRGRKRPFLTPAVKDQNMEFRRIIAAKMAHLRFIK